MRKNRQYGSHKTLSPKRWLFSDFDWLPVGSCVVIYARASSYTSKNSTALQVGALIAALAKLGVAVVGIVELTCSGYDSPGSIHTPWADSLKKARKLAEKHGASIVAADVTRFIRSPSINWDSFAEPTRAEYETLRRLTGGLPLFTLTPPDASAAEIHRVQSERGQKGNRGGRPVKVIPNRSRTHGPRYNQAPLVFNEALSLFEAGYSLREIASHLDRPHSTIQGWLLKDRSG